MADWSKQECEHIVNDYMSMMYLDIRGERYSKAEHRRNLLPLLNQRSEGSIEYKHQNISAILIDNGYLYISGYKPAYNYQALLKSVVEDYLHANQASLDNVIGNFIDSVPAVDTNYQWENVLTDAPVVDKSQANHQAREIQARKYDYTGRELRNRQLGKKGEAFVLEYEKHRLSIIGRDDLANEVEWTSEEKGDGAGYDIRSFNAQKDQELFIEVKTTNSGKYQPFLLTDNELEFSSMNAQNYSLYRVFGFNRDPKLYQLNGRLEEHVILAPKLYKASF